MWGGPIGGPSQGEDSAEECFGALPYTCRPMHEWSPELGEMCSAQKKGCFWLSTTFVKLPKRGLKFFHWLISLSNIDWFDRLFDSLLDPLSFWWWWWYSLVGGFMHNCLKLARFPIFPCSFPQKTKEEVFWRWIRVVRRVDTRYTYLHTHYTVICCGWRERERGGCPEMVGANFQLGSGGDWIFFSFCFWKLGISGLHSSREDLNRVAWSSKKAEEAI